MEKQTVDMIEVWMPSEEGEAVRSDGKKLKLIARIVNGNPVILEKDFMVEVIPLEKRVADLLNTNKD